MYVQKRKDLGMYASCVFEGDYLRYLEAHYTRCGGVLVASSVSTKAGAVSVCSAKLAAPCACATCTSPRLADAVPCITVYMWRSDVSFFLMSVILLEQVACAFLKSLDNNRLCVVETVLTCIHSVPY